ncbi:MAG: helix-turn-helix domain-containing protein [Spirochaetaceae bacterium]|jgi:transcriptional regulator with XRE-family HTH domain|nr:helix-turn-helix domain-containing protein [Spirochaetaceae bacterium]
MKEAELRRILSFNIKHYRGLRGWSQVKLAEAIDISTNFLADIETGKSWVSSLTLVKLANCFKIEVYELFRPRNAPTDEVKQAVKSLVNDISVTFEHSLDRVSKKYLT